MESEDRLDRQGPPRYIPVTSCRKRVRFREGPSKAFLVSHTHVFCATADCGACDPRFKYRVCGVRTAPVPVAHTQAWIVAGPGGLPFRTAGEGKGQFGVDRVESVAQTAKYG